MTTNTRPVIRNPRATFEELEPKFLFTKPDLQVGDKKYYEVTAVQVDADYIETNGSKLVTKESAEGENISVTDWVISHVQPDGSTQQWVLKDESAPEAKSGAMAYFQQRWKAVEGKDGTFSPKSVPTPMVELTGGGTMTVSWGEVGGDVGSMLAQYALEDYNIITAQDVVNLGYTGADEASRAKIEEMKSKQ